MLNTYLYLRDCRIPYANWLDDENQRPVWVEICDRSDERTDFLEVDNGHAIVIKRDGKTEPVKTTTKGVMSKDLLSCISLHFIIDKLRSYKIKVMTFLFSFIILQGEKLQPGSH